MFVCDSAESLKAIILIERHSGISMFFLLHIFVNYHNSLNNIITNILLISEELLF